MIIPIYNLLCDSIISLATVFIHSRMLALFAVVLLRTIIVPATTECGAEGFSVSCVQGNESSTQVWYVRCDLGFN